MLVGCRLRVDRVAIDISIYVSVEVRYKIHDPFSLVWIDMEEPSSASFPHSVILLIGGKVTQVVFSQSRDVLIQNKSKRE